LHAEQIDKRTDDHEQPIHSTERPHADNSCHDHCQHRPDPHEDEKRLRPYAQLYRALGGGWALTDAQWSGQGEATTK